MRALKLQSSVIIYGLLTKENKFPLFISVSSKQMEVCHFHFPFRLHLQNCRIPETWRHGHGGNKSLGDFSKSVLLLLIVQTEVCRFSVG
jgi:hypothetical protein